MKKLKYFIILMRPRQWVKNLFVIAPLLFSQKITNISIVINVLFAFVLFCLFSSSIYLVNDIIDLKDDQKHPKKSKRPLASGLLSSRSAMFMSMSLFSIAFIGSLLLDGRFLLVGLIYWFVNLFYTLYFKHVVIIDVICIAMGFVLRVIAGGIAVSVFSSRWILTTTLFLSLFLGFAKRKVEIVLLSASIKQLTRSVLKDYSVQLIDQFLVICATASIMSYTMFTLSEYAFGRFGTYNLIYTIPFVIFGVLRYFYLIQFTDYCESPTEALFIDKALILNIIFWIICVVYIIYI